MLEKYEPTHLDLFSGIGGFTLAAGWAGFKTVAFVERDKWCRKILAARWPGVTQFGDIAEFNGKTIGEISLLTGGFPCQPFSYSGRRQGQADDRHLWPEMFRVIQESKPDWVIGENVDGFDGLGLDDCISDLEAGGYEVAPPLEIPACAVGARHIRNRIWILANRVGERLQRIPSEDSRTKGTGHLQPDQWRQSVERPEILPEISSGLQTYWFPKVEPVFLGGTHGIPTWAHQAHAIGNAIVPQVAFMFTREIYRLIMQSHRKPT